MNITEKKSKFRGIKIGIILTIVAILLIIAGIFLSFNQSSKERSDNNQNIVEKLNTTTAFFLENNESKLALFNEDGEQLTDFIFTEYRSFVNHTAVVWQGDQVGLIDENGKMIFDFGEYDYIFQRGALYDVSNFEVTPAINQLINSNNKVLYDLNDSEIIYGDYDTIAVLLELEAENKYVVLDYNGNELLSFPKVDGIKEKPSCSEDENYLSVFYNNVEWVFNVLDGTLMATFETTEPYQPVNVSDDGNVVILSSQNNGDKAIKDSQVFDVDSVCEWVEIKNNVLTCRKNGGHYILDENMNVILDMDCNKYMDAKNYLTVTDNKVAIYQNNNLIKELSCRSVSSSMSSPTYYAYLVQTSDYLCDEEIEDRLYEFYKINGEKLNDKFYKKAADFDEQGVAIVSEDGENYYLIDKNGNQISDMYSKIYKNGLYYITVKDGLRGAINQTGKEIVPNQYSSVVYRFSGDKHCLIAETNDSKYIVYDVKRNLITDPLDKEPSIQDNYILVNSNTKIQYYTFDGKLIYEKEI